MIKAIETRYHGYRFRSRLEARWAVFFDEMGIKWEYEPEGYELPSGPYLPDFWVPFLPEWQDHPGAGKFIEIKAQRPTARESRLLFELHQATHHRGMFLVGTPGDHQVWWLDRNGVTAVPTEVWNGPNFVLYAHLNRSIPSNDPVSIADACMAARGARFEHSERER